MNCEKNEELNNCELLNPSYDDVVSPTHYNDTTSLLNCQSLENELEKKWIPKKLLSEFLVLSYFRLGYDKKAIRVADCGTFLEFGKVEELGGVSPGAPGRCSGDAPTSTNFKLHKANFCRDRLCPMCAWRRSYKIFGQVSQIMNVIGSDYDFLFLTLTVPNCSADELVSTLNSMSTAWLNLIRYKRVKTILRGFFKALEITYNKAVDTYHPHIHAVLAVPKNYFISRDYIKRDEWLSLWRKSMKNPRITQVDIRKAKDKRDLKLGDTAVNTLSSAVAEIAKYAVKSSSYLFFDEKLLKNGVYLPNEELTDKVVSVLVPALAGRRLCSFGGCFLKAHQALQLDDAEDGDLIHIDGELRSDIALQIYRYGWSCGTYKLIEIRDNEK